MKTRTGLRAGFRGVWLISGVVGLGLLVGFLPPSILRGSLALMALVIVPGLIWAEWLAPSWSWLERAVLGLLLACVVGPFVLISTARAGLPLSHPLITSLFTLISLTGLVLIYRRRLRTG